MEVFLVSTSVAALAEIGDKTQLLSILLAACFRKPAPIILGTPVLTLINHALTDAVGGWIAHVFGENMLRWVLGVGFIAMADWMLVPDKLDNGEVPSMMRRDLSILGMITVTFFFTEMGDKMQTATTAPATRSNDVSSIMASTTVGVLLVNVSAVLMGNKLMSHILIKLVYRITTLIFPVLGVLVLLGVSK